MDTGTLKIVPFQASERSKAWQDLEKSVKELVEVMGEFERMGTMMGKPGLSSRVLLTISFLLMDAKKCAKEN